MKPPPFAYVLAETLAEATDALAQYGDEGKALAGGQSLVPLLNMRLAQPQVLVDLNALADLQYIRERARGGTPGVSFGAVTRQRFVEDADATERMPLLAEAIAWVGHPQIRNRGTIGGSIAHADPAAELPLVFRALDGVATVRSSRGHREIDAADFFVYAMTPALEPDEVLTDIWLPFPPARTGQAFVEVARRHGDFALVSAACTVTLDPDYHITEARIALGGAAPTPMRAGEAETSLLGRKASVEAFREAGRIAAGETQPTDDVHADAAYRRDVAAVLVERGLTRAFERVPEDPA